MDFKLRKQDFPLFLYGKEGADVYEENDYGKSSERKQVQSAMHTTLNEYRGLSISLIKHRYFI